MATSTASLLADSKSDILSETADTSSSPQRPTSLFTKSNNETTATSLDTSRQSPINAAATISGGLTSAISPNSSTSSITSPSTSACVSASVSNFPPEMPQWKKDLIQRRKSNVARTIGAGTATAANASPVQPHSPSSLTSTSTSTSSTSLMGDHVADVLQMPTTPTKGAKQIASQYDTLTASTNLASTTGKTAEQKIAKTNFNKMPVTLNSPTKSPTTLTHHDSGGHYTPQVELKLATNNADGVSIEGQELPIPKQRSTLCSSKTNNNNKNNKNSGCNNAGKSNNHHQYQSNKRNETSTITSITTTTNITTITTESERGEKSMSITPSTPLTTRLAGFDVVGTIATTAPSSQLRAVEVFETQETETARKPSSSAKCGTYAARQSHSIFESERTLSSVSSESPSVSIGKINSNNSNTNSCQTASGSHKSGAGISDGTTLSTSVTTVCDSEKTATPPGVCGKISSKLQNNQFIKNQVIYQQQKSLEILVTTSPVGGVTSTLTSPTSVVQPSSPNKFANNNTKKMVAVHEIKKTTPQQHSTHQLHHHHQQHHHHQHGTTAVTAATVCGRQRLQQRNSNSNNEDTTPVTNIADFDPSEDLSYGPGIVSKLRCRYLSLALRESMEKERHCLDNLRRATSLNNLLDRNDDEDEDEDVDDEGEGEGEVEEEENSEMHDDDVDLASDASGGGKLDKSSMIFSGGILKRPTQTSNQVGQQQSALAKKTAIYQKYSPNSTKSNSNGHASINQRSVGQNGNERNSSYYMSQSNKVATESSNGAMPTLRHGSRHLKRGNDSLKRARSVEALLCEKTPWNFAMNRSSLQTTTNGGSINGGSGVTIEDKIHNARERLILGTDAMPPRRLTSIIDDTERPPPDLVKQTLKMFEATAHRRGRGGQRGVLGGGEVANKVANYKSIIKEQKPAVVFPKPPASPNKKLNSVGAKQTVKPTVGCVDLLSSPVGRKTAAAAAAIVGNTTPNILEMNKQLSAVTQSTPITTTTSASKLRERIVLSETGTQPDNTPQRNKLLNEPKSELFGSCVESPVSALTKKLEKLCIENEKQSPMKHGIIVKESSQAKAIHADVVVGEGAAEPHSNKIQLVGGSVGVGVVETATSTTSHEPSNRDENTENLRRINRRGRNSSTEEHDPTTKGEKDDGEGKTVSDNNDEDFVVAPDMSVNASDRDSNAQALGIGTFGSSIATSSSSDQSDDDESGRVSVTTKRVTKTALENIAKAGTTQQFKFSGDNSNKTSTSTPIASSNSNNKQILNGSCGGDNSNVIISNPPQESTNSMLNLRATTTGGKQIGVIRPLLTTPPNNQHHSQQQQQHVETFKSHQSIPSTQLTSREIEKNRINEMKKTAANASSMATTSCGIGIGNSKATTAGSVGPTTSLDTVINTNSNNSLNKLQSSATSSPASAAPSSIASGFSELDATNSPLWALRKKRQTPPAAASENTTMVFNFRDREKVPDYIENDGVIFRRKRVLPKPNESGFVRLPDLSLETSTDSDYDDFSMCPPSPCDVQFENAYIVIDGKSSIRQKSKEATFRVQFNDTLTSTFEYPSETSLILEESFEEDHYVNTNDIVSAYENLVLEHIDSATSSPAHHHHHVAVDEIIPLPTTNPNATPTTISTNATTPTKNILGNLPLGSAPLGLYTPIKAPIENIFQLGVTRAPLNNSHATPSNAETNTNGINDEFKSSENGDGSESLEYIKPANENLTIAYSEGTQKTDLLY